MESSPWDVSAEVIAGVTGETKTGNEPNVPAASEWSVLGTVAAYGASVVAFAYALVSLYWALGGRGLISTVGGYVEQFAHHGGTAAVLLAWAAMVLKVVGGFLALALRNSSAQSLINAAQISWDLIAAGGLAFTPTVGGGVLPGQWHDLFSQGKFHHVLVMIGHTKDEGRLFTAIHENSLGRRTTLEDLATRMAGSGVFPDELLGEVAREYELKSTDDVGTELSNILTDALWVAGLEKCRAALARETTVYSYQTLYSYQTFDPEAPESHVHAQFSAIGAEHDSDLPALFQWDDFTGGPPRLTTEQREHALQLGRYWGHFASTGDPNGSDLPTWRPMNDGYIQYLETRYTGGSRAVPIAEYQHDHRFGFWSRFIHPELGDG